MPRYEIRWKMYGFYEVNADDEAEALEIAEEEVSVFPLDWDGREIEVEGRD